MTSKARKEVHVQYPVSRASGTSSRRAWGPVIALLTQ